MSRSKSIVSKQSILEQADNLATKVIAQMSLLDPKQADYDEQKNLILKDMDIVHAAYSYYDTDTYLRALKLCLHYRAQEKEARGKD